MARCQNEALDQSAMAPLIANLLVFVKNIIVIKLVEVVKSVLN